MCTVTFMPVKNRYYITSNRDEKFNRKKAIPPVIYNTGKGKLLFPKDPEAGGTWIAIHENGNAAVLLNGAFVRHIPGAFYEKSRGVILLDIIQANMPIRYFLRMDLSKIEPFTLIVLDEDNLYECRWDGIQKHCRPLNKAHAYIWSSSTLYSCKVAKEKEQCFAGFLREHPNARQEDILHFHQFGGNGNVQNNLKMNRNGLSTVSVTSIALDNEMGVVKYLDMKENKIYRSEIDFIYSLKEEVIF